MKKMISRRNFLKVAGASAAALGLAACGGSSSSTAASTASSTAASAAPAAAGKVYYLNFKPEQDQDWQDLAAEYTKETGVPVTVVTAASGQYETTLMSEMEKSEAPTLFQVNGPVGLANWKDYCYDLSGSQLYGELTSDSFALKDGDAVTSIAYVIETYGIIYNKELLTAAGYTQDDIKGFADLKKVAHLPAASRRYRYSYPAALALILETNNGLPTFPDASICRRSRMAPPPTKTTVQ